MSWPYRVFGSARSWDAADDGRFLAIKTGVNETTAAQIAVVVPGARTVRADGLTSMTAFRRLSLVVKD